MSNIAQVAQQLVALTERFSGSQVQLQFAPKEGKHRKKEEANIAAAGLVLPIKKVKVGASLGLLGSYENKVNGQLLIEGKQDDFVAQSPKGKVKLGGNVYTSEDGSKFYLGYEPQKSDVQTIFVDANGRQLTEEEKISFLLASEIPKAHGASENQGTDDAVLWVTAELKNLSWVKINGKTLVIE
jgi:hypothetical protein